MSTDSDATPDNPSDVPTSITLARVAWAMRLVRELAELPAFGPHRIRRLLTAARDQFAAAAVAVRIVTPDAFRAEPDIATLEWKAEADVARARHRLGRKVAELAVDECPLDDRRVAQLTLYRNAAEPFTPADARWLAVIHAGCVFVYAERGAEVAVTATQIAQLSPRDRETLALLLTGSSEKEVAARVGRSQHTVHTRVKRIYREFGVSSRGELLARCLTTNGRTEP